MNTERACATAGIALFATVAVTSAMPACGSTGENDVVAVDAATEIWEVSIDAGHDSSVFDFGANDADTRFGIQEPDAGPLPIYACGDAATDAAPPWETLAVDATVSEPCPLPPSYCLDSQWLVSFVNGVCEEGVCKYWRTLHDCRSVGGSFCNRGACQFPAVK